MIKTWFTRTNTRIHDAAKKSKKPQDKKDAVIQKPTKVRTTVHNDTEISSDES